MSNAEVWIVNHMGYATRYVTARSDKEPEAALTVPVQTVDILGEKVSSNYAACTEDTYKSLLARCPVFARDIKSGNIVMTTVTPEDTKPAETQISALTAENAALKAELSVAATSSGVAESEKKLAEAQQKLEDALAQIAALKDAGTGTK
jgi:hypothetical protein